MLPCFVGDYLGKKGANLLTICDDSNTTNDTRDRLIDPMPGTRRQISGWCSTARISRRSIRVVWWGKLAAYQIQSINDLSLKDFLYR